MPSIRFIDLFAGMGGIRLGFEQAARALGLTPECVLTSEIKSHAVQTYQQNFPLENIHGDITQIAADDIPDFDFLLAGFPCQPFSSAGQRLGFTDTRGTLFFEIERILIAKKPLGFILENVEGLVSHDNGRTLKVILTALTQLGYHVTWKVLNAADFGIPQDRKRIFILGHLHHEITLEFEAMPLQRLGDLLETGLDTLDSVLTQKVFSHFKPKELYGKSIKDKRGGSDNIHSWDIELKGTVSPTQKRLLETLLRERRKRHWAVKKGIEWMDGMPLTLSEISSFFYPEGLFDQFNLSELLDDLVQKGYLEFEHPKDLVNIDGAMKRQPRLDIEAGYNIVVGKLSFEINKILDPNGICPTLVATDMSRIAVVDGQGLRRLSIREGLRLNGFPDDYQMTVSDNESYDLLGNSVAVPVVKAISERLISKIPAIGVLLVTTNQHSFENMLHSSD
jgi:DNA (cytosine-5)-methyltransferase 1